MTAQTEEITLARAAGPSEPAGRKLLDSVHAIVFDLDGTLVDTLPDLCLALNDALLACGYAPVPDLLVRDSLHGGLSETAAAALAVQAVTGPGLEVLVEKYSAFYMVRAHAHSTVYPAVRELLQACALRGQPLAVCTNKSSLEAARLLHLFQLDGFFSCVVAGDTAAHPKPHPAPLLMALAQLGASPSEALLVGDSHVDALCASNAGVPFILHTAGYGGSEALKHRSAARFSDYAELIA